MRDTGSCEAVLERVGDSAGIDTWHGNRLGRRKCMCQRLDRRCTVNIFSRAAQMVRCGEGVWAVPVQAVDLCEAPRDVRRAPTCAAEKGEWPSRVIFQAGCCETYFEAERRVTRRAG